MMKTLSPLLNLIEDNHFMHHQLITAIFHDNSTLDIFIILFYSKFRTLIIQGEIL